MDRQTHATMGIKLNPLLTNLLCGRVCLPWYAYLKRHVPAECLSLLSLLTTYRYVLRLVDPIVS